MIEPQQYSYLDAIERGIVELVCVSIFGSLLDDSLSRVQDQINQKRRALSWYTQLPCSGFLILYDAAHFVFLRHSYRLTRKRRRRIWTLLSRLPVLSNFNLYYESVCVYFFFAGSGEKSANRSPGHRAPPSRAKVVVIGSGPGGAVTADCLAQSGRDVLVLEEGPEIPDAPDQLSPPLADRYCRGGGVTVTFGNVTMSFVEGRCFGGGSEISGGLYYRTPAHVLERWRDDFGVVETSDMEPHFRVCEEKLRIGHVEDTFNRAKAVLERGAESLGWNVTKVSSCHFLDQAGKLRRSSVASTFLRSARELGAGSLTGARVHRIRPENGQYELDCTVDGSPHRLRCESVFVSAGATQTPLLLVRSGVRKNVGRTLRFQPIVKVVAEFDEEVNTGRPRMPPYHIRSLDSRFVLGSSVSSLDQIALNLLLYPKVLAEVRHSWRRMLIFHVGITSSSAGRILAVRNRDDPIVLFRASTADFEKLNEGLSKMSQLLLNAGAKAVYVNARGLAPIRELDRVPKSLDRRQLNLFCYHLSSSCPMGENEALRAVDSFGRVEGHKGLIVSDSSMLSTAPSVNPQGSIMAFARRNALRYLERP